MAIELLILALFQTVGAASPQPAPTPTPQAKPAKVCGIDASKLDFARDLTAPKRVKAVPPVYPEAAVKSGKSGKVVIEMTITESGETADVKVKSGIDPDLDKAALAAVSQWVYEPALALGKPCATILTVNINFKLPTEDATAPPPTAPSSPE